MRYELVITDKQLSNFRSFKARFYKCTNFPKPDGWKFRSVNDLWHSIVQQVAVVGGSNFDAYILRKGCHDECGYNKLLKLDASGKKKAIHKLLREAGVRYVGKRTDNRKVNAIVKNLEIVDSHGGPKKFIKTIVESGSKDRERIQTLLDKKLGYIKLKGARDLLMTLGAVKSALAFDSRLQSLFDKLKIRLPDKYTEKSEIYSEVEDAILEQICRPLEMSGVELDRLLYQNYDRIISLLEKREP